MMIISVFRLFGAGVKTSFCVVGVVFVFFSLHHTLKEKGTELLN